MAITLIPPMGGRREQNSAYDPFCKSPLFINTVAIVKNMKLGLQNKWLLGGLTFLFVWAIPLSAFCEKASIQEVNVQKGNGIWNVSFYVENCFTEKMEEAIKSGIRTIFTYYLHLYQKRVWWKDRKVASSQFHHTIQYDPIRGEYRVTFGREGPPLVTKNFEEAKKWMAKVESVEIRPSSELRPGIPTYLRIKAELDPVRLPLHLEYLFFFVSLWDFDTDWHTQLLPL